MNQLESIRETLANFRSTVDDVSIVTSTSDSALIYAESKILENELEQFAFNINNALLAENAQYNGEYINESDNIYSASNVQSIFDTYIGKSIAILYELNMRVHKFEDSIILTTKKIINNKDKILSYNRPIENPYNFNIQFCNLQRSYFSDSMIFELMRLNRKLKAIDKDTDPVDEIDIDKIYTHDSSTQIEALYNNYSCDKLWEPVLQPYTIQALFNDMLLIPDIMSSIHKDIDSLRQQLESSNHVIDFNNTTYADKVEKLAEAIIDTYILDCSIRIDSIENHISNIIAVLMNTLNAVDPIIMYDTDGYVENFKIDDIKEEVDLMQTLFMVETGIIYNESVINLESAGLITVNEETAQEVQYYFEKIIQGMGGVIQQIQAVIRNKIQEKLNPMVAKLKSPDKPDPEFNIKNFKSFNFERLDNIKPVRFKFDEMKDELQSREKFVHRYYPELEDNQEKNFYKIMLKKVMVKQTSVKCTKEIIDSFVDFLLKDYNLHIEGLSEFQDAISEASNQASNIATVAQQTEEREVQQIAHQQQVIQQQESAIVEDGDNTSFEDNDRPRDSGEGNTNIMKCSTLYCSILSRILSARIKVLNYAYNDRLKIVMHYAVKNKFNKEER